MKQSLQLRMSQHLALTPQLQQSIRLLQLSTLELNQELEQILADNPLLERTDDPLASCMHVSADGSLYPDQPPPMLNEPTAPEPSAEEAPRLDAPESGDDANREYGADLAAEYGRPQRDDDDGPPQLGDGGTTLREHLLTQIMVEKLGIRERILTAAMIESLDDDGYLHATEEELVDLLPEGMTLEAGDFEEALEILHSLEPAGVGARSISECLALQLKSDLPVVREVPDDVRECALRMCRDHLALLAQRDFTKLRKALGANDDLLRDAHALVRRLDPYPGSAFSSHELGYVIPDVIVRKIKGEWIASLNRDVMPKLRINQMYAQALKTPRGGNNAAASNANGSSPPSPNATNGTVKNVALTSHLQEARWLIKNVQQRFDTILRVAQAIVERQRAFFSHGEVAMRPLVLREIADILGLHESTVSRVTTQKFMLTPFGTFELKYFFGSHVATETGGAASSTAIRALIRQLIGAENTREPLSDSKLAEMLGEQGIVVARRTVAKYRESLKIPPVNLRKSL